MFTKEMIEDYADKLLIGLSDEECDLLLKEFDVIKEKMEIIENIDGINKVEPLSFPQDIKTKEYRSGKDTSNIKTADALSNCEDKIEDVVIVPKVVG